MTMPRKRILKPGDLPKRFQRAWAKLARRYVNSRVYKTRDEAEAVAFEEMRKLYWGVARTAREGDTSGSFDITGGDDADARRDEGPK